MLTKGTISVDPPLIIKYTAVPSPDVYYTDDDSHVMYNNHFLGLDLHEFDDKPRAVAIQRFNMYFVYTSKKDWKYEQHIFLQSADKNYIRQFAQTLPKESSEILYEIAGL